MRTRLSHRAARQTWRRSCGPGETAKTLGRVVPQALLQRTLSPLGRGLPVTRCKRRTACSLVPAVRPTPVYVSRWPMAGATVIEIIATLPTNNLLPAVTGLEQADRKAV